MENSQLIFVVVAALLAGAFVATFLIHFHFTRALDRAMHAGDRELKAFDAQLRALQAPPAPAGELELELRAQIARDNGPQEPLELVRAPGAAAANSAYAFSPGVPGIIKRASTGAEVPSARAASPKRPCKFCDRVRRALGLQRA